jgi:hypothetical protein
VTARGDADVPAALRSAKLSRGICSGARRHTEPVNGFETRIHINSVKDRKAISLGRLIRLLGPGCLGLVDPDLRGKRLGVGDAAHEALRVHLVGGGKDGGTGLDALLRAAMVDVSRPLEADTAVVVLVVVPGEEVDAVGAGILDAAEALGKIRAVLEGLEPGLGKRVVVGHAGARMRLGDTQVGEELCDELRAHRAAAVGVYRELAGHDALALAGLRDELLGERAALVRHVSVRPKDGGIRRRT